MHLHDNPYLHLLLLSSQLLLKMGAAEVESTVELLLSKSKGAFVYVARMLEHLANKDTCSMKDIQDCPDGLKEEYLTYFRKVGLL